MNESDGDDATRQRQIGDVWRVRGFDAAGVALAAFDSDGRLCVANAHYRQMLPIADHPIAQTPQERAPIPGGLPAGVEASAIFDRSPSEIVRIARSATPDGGWIETAMLTDAKNATADWFHTLIHYDDLTGLANRTYFQTLLNGAIAAGRRGAVLSLRINDVGNLARFIGFTGADQALRAVSGAIAEAAGDTGLVGRIGDVKFVIFAADLVGREEAAVFAERLQTALAQSALTLADGVSVDLETTLGYTCFETDAHDAAALIQQAEVALSHARDARLRQTGYAVEMSQRAARRGQITQALRGALAQDEFTVFYQPKIDLFGRRVVGMEALLRWTGAQTGVIRPDEFIPVAETTGHIAPLTDWVLRRACHDTARLVARGYGDLKCAVNISTAHFRRQSVVNSVMTALDDADLDPQHLEVEITESLLLSSEDVVAQTFSWLKDIGVTIAIDDFGTGYSSLAYLSQFNPDTVKIDKSFVMTALTDASHAEICKAIIALAHALGMTVVAEGVETGAQLNLLSAYGCDIAQGYLFAKPMPADALDDFLADYEPD